MDDLVKQLRSFECHFNWNLEELCDEREQFPSIQDKVAVKNEEISGHTWRHVVLDSVICYEDCKTSPTSADQKIHECMTCITSGEDPFVKKHKVALENVFNAFKAHVALLNSTVSRAQELARKIVPFSEMSPEEKAAVMGFKCSVIMEYGKEGTMRSLEFAKEALKYDPAEPEWHFLVGKILQRIRNFNLVKIPSDEERKSLEKAFEMSKAPHHAIFLSSCLHNVSCTIFYSIPLQNGRRNINIRDAAEMDALNSRCVALLKHAAEGNPDCPHNLIRIARGFFALPKKFKNLPYAQKLVDACLEKAPDNPMVNIVASQIGHSLGETERAIKLAKKAGELGAHGGYMRFFELQVDAKVNFDEEALYKLILSKYNTPLDVGKTCLHATCFYLFVKNDRFTSFEYFEKALETNCDLHNLIKKMYVRWIWDSINLYDVMYNEAKHVVSSLTDELGPDHARLKIPKYIIFKITMLSATSAEKSIDPHMVKRLVDNANRKLGGSGQVWSRGGGSQRRGCAPRGGYTSVSLSAFPNRRQHPTRDNTDSWRGNTSSTQSRKYPENRKSSDGGSSRNQCRERASPNAELPKTLIEPDLDTSISSRKSSIDELKKTVSNNSNYRRSNLLAMLENMNLEPKHGETPGSSVAEDTKPLPAKKDDIRMPGEAQSEDDGHHPAGSEILASVIRRKFFGKKESDNSSSEESADDS